MSIILDALNKLENSEDKVALNNLPDTKKPHKTRKKILVYFVVVFLGLVTARTIFIFLPKYLQSVKKAAPQKPKLQVQKQTPSKLNAISSIKGTLTAAVKQISIPLPKTITEKVSTNNLVLNGIAFSSNDDNYALVNNKIVKKGDTIDGLTVLEIKENEVELQSEDSKIIKLSPSIKQP